MMELSDAQISRFTDPDGLVLEAWGQGLMVGSLVIMTAVILANMKGRILLHKLILIELLLAIPHGTFIFNKPPVYGWYLSVSAVVLNLSWTLHNVISWMKSKPFYSRRVSIAYITTVLLVQPYWVLEIYANFTYFNNINRIDPWWICTACSLFYAIKCSYNFGTVELATVSPRLGIMLASMCLSIVFIVVDTCSVLGVSDSASLPIGVQPFWKLSLIFKCLCNAYCSHRQHIQARIQLSNCDTYPANRRPRRSVSASS
ncbi:hypothetical protein BDW72DRAFT_212065 [Aspergillus terricola var. indicus]